MVRMRSGLIEANGAEFYHEVRGSGPPLLFVSMGGGDAGEWRLVAEILAESHTVVTYDRRGNSRSPWPDGWTPGPVSERSDDAAALLDALDLAPAVVVGCRGGACVVIDLVARHPDHLAAAIVYEPPLYLMLPDGREVFDSHVRIAEEARSDGGEAAAIESWGKLAAGDETWQLLDSQTRRRILANAATHWQEVPHTLAFEPDVESLRHRESPVAIAFGTGVRDGDPRIRFLYDSCVWLSEQTGLGLTEIVGPNFLYWKDPQAFADQLRRLLGRLTAP